MAQQNFLGQLVQSGALKGYDPTRSVERATNIQAAQTGIESGQLTSNMKRLEIGKSALMQVQDKDDYQGYRNFMVGEIGLNQDLFPQNFADDNAFEEWKGSALLSADQIIKAQSGKPFMVHKVNPDGTKVNIKINSMDQYKRWSDAGLIDDTYSLGEVSGAPTRNEPIETWVHKETGDTLNLPYSQAPPGPNLYVKYKTPTGMDISVGKEGTRIRTGVGRGAKQTLKTTGAIEAKALAAVEGISRLNEIASSYRPEYLQLGTKLKSLKTKWQEIGEGTPIETILGSAEPEDQQLLSDFSDFKRNSISNINLYIKEITGAQMSEKEADRLRLGMPDPGKGLLDGDSPTQFTSKWKSTMKSLKLSAARQSYLLKNGATPESIEALAKSDLLPDLASMTDIIKNRAKEIQNEIKSANPGMSQGEIDINVSARLKEEFGL